jgi:cyanophycin synthetase
MFALSNGFYSVTLCLIPHMENKMKIVEQHFLSKTSQHPQLRGQETDLPCISTLIDLQTDAHLKSTDIEGFYDRLLTALPSLQAHRYPPHIPGGFVEQFSGPDGFVQRLRDGLALPQVIEGVALELQFLAGQGAEFSYTQKTDECNQFRIVCAYHQQEVANKAMSIAVDTVQKLARGQAVNLTLAIEELKQIAMH